MRGRGGPFYNFFLQVIAHSLINRVDDFLPRRKGLRLGGSGLVKGVATTGSRTTLKRIQNICSTVRIKKFFRWREHRGARISIESHRYEFQLLVLDYNGIEGIQIGK